MSKRIAYVDADSLIYAAASVAQLAYYEVGNELFKSLVDAREHCHAIGMSEENIEEYFYPKGKWCAVGALRSLMKKCTLDDFGSKLADAYIFVVSVPDAEGKTWREHAYPDYKETRRHKKSPLWRRFLLNHMKEKYGAAYVEGWEADDIVTTMAYMTEACPLTPVVVHIDKDLDQIPGLHWNWKNAQAYEVTPYDAEYARQWQVLAGDAIDNITGLPGLGDKGATDLLADSGPFLADLVLAAFIDRADLDAHAKALALVTMRKDAPVEDMEVLLFDNDLDAIGEPRLFTELVGGAL